MGVRQKKTETTAAALAARFDRREPGLR